MIEFLPQTPQQRLVAFFLRRWAVIALTVTLAIGWVVVKNLQADVRLAQATTTKAEGERDAAIKRAADFEQSYLAIAAAAREQSQKIVALAAAQEAARAEGEKRAAAARADAAKYKARAEQLATRPLTPGRDPVQEVSEWIDEQLRKEREGQP